MECFGTIAALATSLTLALAEPVIIGTEAPFPPYTLVDAEGTITGFERDVMDVICDRAKLDCTWKLARFDQLIPGVMAGEYDVVLGGMAVTEERRMLVDFTTSYYKTDPEEWYIGRPGTEPPTSALTAVQSGTVHEAHLRELGLRYTSFATEPEVLEALQSGAADLALGSFALRPDLEEFIAQNGFEFLYSDIIPDEGVAMAVCKGNTDLLDTLNAALDALRADGTLATLESRWFN